jgi:methionyl-tRNA formyltransferase
VTCALGAIRLVRVVPEGKAPMSGAQFARGR